MKQGFKQAVVSRSSAAIGAIIIIKAPGVVPWSNQGGPAILAALGSPANTVMVADSDDSYQMDWPDVNSVSTTKIDAGLPALGWNGGNFPKPTEGDMVFRHGSKDIANVVWCDGHAKSMRLSQLTGKNSGGYLWQFTMAANPN